MIGNTFEKYAIYDKRQDFLDATAVKIEYLSNLSSMAYLSNIATQIHQNHPSIIEMEILFGANEKSQNAILVENISFIIPLLESTQQDKLQDLSQYFTESVAPEVAANSRYLMIFHNKLINLKEVSEWDPSDGLTLFNKIVGDSITPF